MHELSLCRSISSIALRAAQGRKVAVIELDVGQLRQVVPETLVYCWTIVAQTTPLEGSRLRINHIPGVLHCRDCAHDTHLSSGLAILRCTSCGSPSVDVVHGEEFSVNSLELEG
ncbi:MAG: hydrogenase maturation nickel metallochaperone HypA [Propionibacteriaceae bacterium]|nr:hydrogenase maturation nickel metallochaperone HypA [Propionibacteriaceae bacterium]